MPTNKQVIEALLFASDAPVGLSTLVEVLEGPSPKEVTELLAELKREYETTERGVALAEIAGGYQILSRKECGPWIDRMLRSRRKARLTRAGLETLAIVAYKQPITKTEIDSIRGVDSSGSLHTLLERNLVLIRGRSKAVGRPLLYGTTPEFLSYMGVNDLADLPELKELGSVLEERERLHGEIDGVDAEAPPSASSDAPNAEDAPDARSASDDTDVLDASGESTSDEPETVTAGASPNEGAP